MFSQRGLPNYLFGKTNAQDKRICLTIDDGPNPYATLKILDVLDNHDVKAVFFLIGARVEKNPALAGEIFRRGQAIGNHSYCHDLWFCNYGISRMEFDLRRAEAILRGCGIPACKFFRPPGGICNNKVLRASKGYSIAGVNHWISDNFIFSSRVMARKLLDSIRKRGPGVVVLHEGAVPLTARTRAVVPEALGIIIPQLKEQGYTFCTLEECARDNSMIIPAERN